MRYYDIYVKWAEGNTGVCTRCQIYRRMLGVGST